MSQKVFTLLYLFTDDEIVKRDMSTKGPVVLKERVKLLCLTFYRVGLIRLPPVTHHTR